MKTSFVGQFE